MRDYIDIARRLTEDADILPFPTAKRSAQVAQDRHRFTLVVVEAESQGEGTMPKMHLVDRLSDLSVEELVDQLRNYHPEHQRNGTWMSNPIGNRTFYMRVLVGKDSLSERDLAEIEQHLATAA